MSCMECGRVDAVEGEKKIAALVQQFSDMVSHFGLGKLRSDWETEAAFFAAGAGIDIDEFISAYDKK